MRIARIIPFPARATRYAACALIGWGVVLNGVFLVRNAPVVWPDTFVSHAAIWKEVLKETQSSIHEGRPTRNIYLPKLGEFGFEARRYEALMKHELRIPPDQQINWTEKEELELDAFFH